MIDLPDDLKYMVVGYISLPSDLRSLCLTSRSWYRIVAPRLPTNVILKVHDRKAVDLFLQAADAGLDLRKIRSLTLVDGDSSTAKNHYDETTNSLNFERDAAANLLLRSLPRDILETFRFIPGDIRRPLGADSMVLLLKRQRKLKHLPTVDTHFFPLNESSDRLVADLLKLLDLTTLGVAHFPLTVAGNGVLGAALRYNPNLVRLCVDTYSTMTASFAVRDLARTVDADFLPKAHLRELILREADLDDFTMQAYSRFINFASLERLVLWRSTSEAAVTCLSSLEKSFHDRDNAPLQHLAIDTSLRRSTPMSEALVNIYKACPKLKSLHFSGNGVNNRLDPQHYSISLPRLSKSLEILSIHDPTTYDMNPKINYYTDTEAFWSSFQSFPNLRQLGLQFDQQHIESGRWETYELFLDQLKVLPELRTLHLRQRKKCAANFDPQPFVEFLFDYIIKNTICPRLGVVIIGMKDAGRVYKGEVLSHNDDVAAEQVREKALDQHCFVRDQGINLFDNMPHTLAVPVQRSWLIDHCTDLEILDYDPGVRNRVWPGWYRDE